MNTLLDTELGDVNVESGIEDTDNLGLTDDRTVALGEVVDKDTKEQVSGLLLRQTCRVLLAVINYQQLVHLTLWSELTCCIAGQPWRQHHGPW